MKNAIIIANGKAPKKTQLDYFISKKYSTLICADGGANTALKLNLVPNFIIGDFDSISIKALEFFESKTKFIRIKRQNDTDVEKALKFLISKNFTDVLLVGATGDRLDHTICNLGIIIKYFNKINISLLHENSFLRAYNSDVKLNTKIGETISIYAFDKKTKITSKGLKYPLKNISLPFGEKESTSNIAAKNFINLKISNGIIFVIRDFLILKEYDLF